MNSAHDEKISIWDESGPAFISYCFRRSLICHLHLVPFSESSSDSLSAKALAGAYRCIAGVATYSGAGRPRQLLPQTSWPS